MDAPILLPLILALFFVLAFVVIMYGMYVESKKPPETPIYDPEKSKHMIIVRNYNEDGHLSQLVLEDKLTGEITTIFRAGPGDYRRI